MIASVVNIYNQNTGASVEGSPVPVHKFTTHLNSLALQRNLRLLLLLLIDPQNCGHGLLYCIRNSSTLPPCSVREILIITFSGQHLPSPTSLFRTVRTFS